MVELPLTSWRASIGRAASASPTLMRFASFVTLSIALLLPCSAGALGCASTPEAESPADPPATASAPAPSTPSDATSAASAVIIGRTPPAASCVRVGEVHGSSASGFRGLANSFKVAGEEMQQSAVALGGDYVQEETLANNGREVFRQGTAYRCAGTAPAGDVWNDDRTSPKGAAGFLFGESASVAEDRCRARGFDWSVGAGYGRCTGAPVDTGFGGEVAVRFCGDRLCGVVLSSTPPAHDSKAWIAAFARLRAVLEGKYGKPFHNDAQIPTDCRDDVLPCLDDARASVEVTWSWHGGRRIALRMGKLDDKSGDNAIRLRYDEPQEGAPQAGGL